MMVIQNCHEGGEIMKETTTLLTTKDLMNIFKVERNTIYNWKKKGLINFFTVNNRHYTTWEEIEKMFERQ